MITCKSQRELGFMREAGRIVAQTLEVLRRAVEPGVTTGELDTLAEQYIRAQGARPAFKGLYGFPASICTSVNEQVVHGIPGLKTVEKGDIISIDIGAEINGYYGDAAYTFPVGEVSPAVQRLLAVTQQALYAGIAAAKPGSHLSDISHAVQSVVEENGFSVVREYVGHGIGRSMHEDPQVPNFGRPGRGPRLRAGMTLAIEPMVNEGGRDVLTLADEWTVITRDRRHSAHFEHTVVVTDGEPDILTRM